MIFPFPISAGVSRPSSRRHRTGSIAAAIALATSGLLGTPMALSAQGNAAAFGDRVDVQLVNVEVWVSDRQGNPVTGLTRADFEVREDGKVVEISNFSEIRGALPGQRAATGDGTAEPPATSAENEPLELADLLQETPEENQPAGFLVLYFDQLFTGMTGRQQLIDDLRDLLEQQRLPASRVLILSQDEDLRVEANLGSTRSELEAALERLTKTTPGGVRTWAREKNVLRQLQADWERVAVLGSSAPGQNPCDFFAAEAFREVQIHADTSQARVRQTLNHLENTAGFLAGLPGPKTLLYISDGLPTSPGSDLLSFIKHLCPAQSVERRLDLQASLNEDFRRLSRHANANRVTIYSIQALGLRQVVSLTTADQKGVQGTARALTRFDSESREQNRGGLVYLAKETGGRAVINRGAFLDELEEITDDMQNYYSLAYTPRHGGDGREHTIKVKVRGEGLQLRHRPGYLDKSADERMLERLESALYLNLMTNPLGVGLGAGNLKGADKGRFTVPIHVRVPVDQVTFLPARGADQASLRVVVLARDERNRRAAFKQERYDFNRPTETAEGQTFSLQIELDLPVGIHVIAFGVRDEATQESSFVATSLEIAPPPAAVGGR